ncbi:hypothetical protein F0562_022441 [Nyssa sinensis]|uniref:Retrotransposon gag domain-containing protein n=1 Tax=Nyssa sinensis TaxID=561372 RepID=A0A5J5BNN1_9ASTE|nr:hypothetical protein F0562_022441 [Nyssa sinensis]
MQFGRFDTTKAAWDFLVDRYTTASLFHQYQLQDNIHRLRQEPGEPMDTFHSRMQAFWDQLTASEPTRSCSQDATKFLNYRNQQCLIQFLMALDDVFEPTCAILLHRTPLSTLENAISKLVSYETRRCTRPPPHTESALAAPSSACPPHTTTALAAPFSGRPSHPGCKFCHAPDHTLLYWPTRVYKHCHKRGPGHFLHDCPNYPTPQPHADHSQGNSSWSNRFKFGQQSTAAAATEDPSPPAFPSSSLSLQCQSHCSPQTDPFHICEGQLPCLIGSVGGSVIVAVGMLAMQQEGDGSTEAVKGLIWVPVIDRSCGSIELNSIGLVGCS